MAVNDRSGFNLVSAGLAIGVGVGRDCFKSKNPERLYQKNRVFAGVMLLSLVSTAHGDLSALQWLAGCWTQDGRDAGSVEQWTAPAGGTMLGMNRIVSGGRTVAFEYMRIEVDEDNLIEFIALPSGQETARFKMVSMKEHEIVFENPEHDFPTRIIYKHLSDDSLLGRIEGIDRGTPRTVEFPMTRSSCEPGDESS